jgi:DNA-binding transcriptional regulator/RsmH inhibitor MraZ
MSEQKQEKQQVLIRVRHELYDSLFDEAGRATLDRKARVSVPSLVVEQLEFVSTLKAHHPDIYEAAKAAVERLNKS